MFVTIMTDASWCPDTGAAGYGYWIACERGRRGGGNVLTKATTHNDAEMMAVANAIHIAVACGLVQSGDDLLVQTDSTHTIGRFTNSGHKATEVEHGVIEAVETLRDQNDLKIRYKHVKGHTGYSDNRSVANAHCDRRAGQHMRRRRRELRQSAASEWARN